jgi:hypothetical protein
MLTGVGTDYDLLCRPCADSADPRSALIQVCEGCLDRLEEPFEVLGWHGSPQIVIADEDQQGRWTEHVWAAVPVNDRCLAALPDGWLVLTEERLIAIDADGGTRDLPMVRVPAEQSPDEAWLGHVRGPALHTSADGRLVAVVTDYGQYGTLFEVETGRALLQLDRQSYHNETTPFPIAFLGTGDATRLIAATGWNSLDLFDALTGRKLTTGVGNGYLDHIFHGRLTASPLGRRVLDDGWAWHPVGMPSVIDLQPWLTGSLQAPLVGQKLAQREYAWDQPVAWLDENTVAIQRIGDDDDAMIDGVTLYDATTGRRAGMFAGPSGRMWGHAGQLFVASTSGLEIWEPAGVRVGLLEGFRPTVFNPLTATFAELSKHRLRTWRPAAES